MRPVFFVAIMASFGLAACTSTQVPGDSAIDTTTSDSGDITQDTYEPSASSSGPDTWSADSDTTDSTPTDTDSGSNPPLHTGGCIFGEVEDCRGACYPIYLIGDGFCDDASNLPADFNCATHTFDGGDCATQDTQMPASTCSYMITMYTGLWPLEMSWTLYNDQGQVVASAQQGSYVNSNTTEGKGLNLADGTYILHVEDAYGDGWNGGIWSMRDAATGRELFTTPSGGRWSVRNYTITVACQRTACSVDIHVLPGREAADMGWEIRSTAGTVIASAPVGTYQGTAPIVERVSVFDGSYTLRSRAASKLGWQGGMLEARQPGGWLISAVGIGSGKTTDVVDLPVICDHASMPPIDQAPPTITPSSCQDLSLTTTTFGHGSDIRWEIYYVDDWASVGVSSGVGFPDNTSVSTDLGKIESGRYLISMNDATGDGWGGSFVSLVDGSGQVLTQVSLPHAAHGAKYVQIECPPVVPDTASPTTCLTGAVADCDGVCMPVDYIGDGRCDDGIAFGANFNCTEHNFDSGDCTRDSGSFDSGTSTDTALGDSASAMQDSAAPTAP